jgi:hypothetical protein
LRYSHLQVTQRLEATQKTGHLGINLLEITSETCQEKNIPQSISTGAQYVALDNKIKCLSLAVFLLGNPTNKTELHISGNY